MRGVSAWGLCLPGSLCTSPFLVFPLSLSALLVRHRFLSSHPLSCHTRILRMTFRFQHPNPSPFHSSELPWGACATAALITRSKLQSIAHVRGLK